MPDTEPSDETLLERFAAGDRAALGPLAHRYEAMLLGLCAGLLGGRRELAMDAVQETWVRVIRSAATFAGRSSFRTWVYRIALNQCRTMLAKTARQASPSRHDLAAVPPGDCGAGERGEGNGGGEAAALVREAVASLAAPKAEVLLLCYHAGLTHEQAAELLEIPLGTLKSRLHAALGELRRSMPSEVSR